MLFQKTTISSIATHRSLMSAMPMEHLLLLVENGAGKLRSVWFDGGTKGASCYDGNAKSALMLGKQPLIQIQSCGCPTCESLLAAGHGRKEGSKEISHMRDTMNAPYISLEDAMERLRPLLTLLPSGGYILTYSSCFPTDGDGHFFWDVPEKLTSYLATAEYYSAENYRLLPSFPSFFYPTQGAQRYDAKQVEHYRALLRAGTPIPPVLAYALHGYMSALLDGHHRACACALEGKAVPCLTISCPPRYWDQGVPHILWPDGSRTKVEGLMNARQAKLMDSVVGERRHEPYPYSDEALTFRRCWEPEYGQSAARYPTCREAGALALYPEIRLNAEGIRTLAMDDDYEDAEVAAWLLHFAARQPEADKKALSMAFLEAGYPAVLRTAAFEILGSIKDDAEVEDLMIAVLVNCERKDDPIYRIANAHWET